MDAPLTPTSLALWAAGAGNVTVLAAATGGAEAAAPWIQGGGSAAAVAGLVYVARLIVKGDLVPRSVKDAENELTAGIMAAGQREAKVLALAEQSARETNRAASDHDQALLLLADVRRIMGNVAEEMQYWREMRDRGTRREDGGPEHRGPGGRM